MSAENVAWWAVRNSDGTAWLSVHGGLTGYVCFRKPFETRKEAEWAASSNAYCVNVVVKITRVKVRKVDCTVCLGTGVGVHPKGTGRIRCYPCRGTGRVRAGGTR